MRRAETSCTARYHVAASEVIMKLQIVLEPSEEGGFTASVPSLPGCVSEGDSREEALRNIREAIELYLEPVSDDLAGKEGVELAELVV
jgi:predicted RNase H-like HicB family nuclease